MPPSSFRSILCSRILLLLLPVLGLSGWMAYAKVRFVLGNTTLAPASSSAPPAIGSTTMPVITPSSHRDRDTALSEIAWLLGGTTAFTMATVTALAIYLSRELAHPVETLRNQMRAVQRQLENTSPDLQVEPLPLQSLKIREFQQLATTFNQLAECLEQRTTALALASREATSACQMKSQFLAATSHELRTPLNALIGHIHLIQDGCCDNREEELECLAQANQAALHLLHVLNELLDIARIEAGEFELNWERLDLHGPLQEVIKLQRPSLEQKELALELGVVSQPVWIWGDRAKLRQVLLNILQNAIKFTDRGRITITLQVAIPSAASMPDSPTEESSAETPPTGVAILRITDTGIGVDPKQQKALFQPFSRVSNTPTRQFEGTGLGLVISRSLLEGMGGQIQLSSPGLGQGTRVEIRLPIHTQPPGNRNADPSTSDPLASDPLASDPATSRDLTID